MLFSEHLGSEKPRTTVAGEAKPSPQASLGIYGNTVDQTVARAKRRREARRVRMRDRRTAAALLPDEKSLGACGWALQRSAEGVGVVLRDGDEPRAHLVGLQHCGSVWLCPCCSHTISETRRDELNRLLVWGRGQGFKPMMITLTASHALHDPLAGQLGAMKEALRTLRQRREWRRLAGVLRGSVTATEVTHGSNGWHSHFHILVLLEADSEEAARTLLDPLGDVWRTCLASPKSGLSGGKAAFHVAGAAAAGRYIAKWGAGEELTLTGSKKGRGGGRSPRQLLEDAGLGDVRAAALWREYARAFKGRKQLTWSKGLKAAAGVDQVTDEEAAAEAEEVEEEEAVTLLVMPPRLWREAGRKVAARLLDMAEITGSAGALWAVLESVLGPSTGGFRPPHAMNPPAGGPSELMRDSCFSQESCFW